MKKREKLHGEELEASKNSVLKKQKIQLKEEIKLVLAGPAVAQLRKTDGEVIVVRSNYRFRGNNEPSIYYREERCKDIGIDLISCLKNIIENEYNESVNLKRERENGYMGVTSDTTISIKRK